jgi:hypothetical protein
MAFVNEPVSDADIDRYELPFEKGSGRYWTRDAERDYYMWGGKVGNPAFDEPIEGRFTLYLDGELLSIGIQPEEGSYKMSDIPFHVRWGKINYISPTDRRGLDRDYVLAILRDALVIYGWNGRNTLTDVRVSIGF